MHHETDRVVDKPEPSSYAHVIGLGVIEITSTVAEQGMLGCPGIKIENERMKANQAEIKRQKVQNEAVSISSLGLLHCR